MTSPQYVSTHPVEGRYRIVMVLYRYAGLAWVRDALTQERWIVGTIGKRGTLAGYTKMQ